MKKIPILFKIPYPILKWSALFFMTYDHVLKSIFKIGSSDPVLIPGRFAFPLFMFMIFWNAAHKDIITKYIKRMLPFALVTLAVDLVYFPKLDINILFSFIITLSMIGLFDWGKKIQNKDNRLIFYVYIGALMSVLAYFCDYGTGGLWVMFFAYKFFQTRNCIYYAACIMLLPIIATPAILTALVTFAFTAVLMLVEPVPTQKRSAFKKTGWMFYAYFPFHKWIIAMIAKFIG